MNRYKVFLASSGELALERKEIALMLEKMQVLSYNLLVNGYYKRSKKWD
jgi:hypothetical protein